MGRRLELQELLSAVPGVEKAYFTPPDGATMVYPCIVYNLNYVNTKFADNVPYLRTERYQVTVMDQDPDTVIKDAVADLPTASFERAFAADDVYHFVYNLYY